MHVVLFLKPSHFCRFSPCSLPANGLVLGLTKFLSLSYSLKYISVFVGKRRLLNIRGLRQWSLKFSKYGSIEPMGAC